MAEEREEQVAFELSNGALDALKEIAKARGGISLSEALEEAIGSGLLIVREKANGSRILIRRREGTELEVNTAG